MRTQSKHFQLAFPHFYFSFVCQQNTEEKYSKNHQEFDYLCLPFCFSFRVGRHRTRLLPVELATQKVITNVPALFLFLFNYLYFSFFHAKSLFVPSLIRSNYSLLCGEGWRRKKLRSIPNRDVHSSSRFAMQKRICIHPECDRPLTLIFFSSFIITRYDKLLASGLGRHKNPGHVWK